MCTILIPKESARLRKNFRRRKNPITVYKLLIHNKKENTYSSIFGAIDKCFLWTIGEEHASNRYYPGIFPEERKYNPNLLTSSGGVQKGFHFFLRKEDIPHCCNERYQYLDYCPYIDATTRNYSCQYSPRCILGEYRGINRDNPMIITKMEVQPKDIVAIGSYEETKMDITSLVAIKAKFIRVLD